MIKIIVPIFLLFIYSQCVFAATYVADSCSRDHVAAAIASATNSGDIVSIPAGDCDWVNTYVSVDKAIKIIGAGATATKITGSTGEVYMFDVNVGASDANFPFRLSGIQITKPSEGGMVRINGSGNGWRVDNNRFIGTQDLGTGYPDAVLVNATGAAWSTYGLIDSNYIYWCYAGVGSGADASNASWAAAPGWGNLNAVYFENNTIDWELNTHTLVHAAVDNNYGSRFVVRYNLFKDCQLSSHSKCGALAGGARRLEAYNNKFLTVKCVVGSTFWLNIRGGSAVATDNEIGGCWSINVDLDGKIGLDNQRSGDQGTTCNGGGVGWCDDTDEGIDNQDDTPDTGYICARQPGAGTFTGGKYTSDPLYFWDNIVKGVCSGGSNKWGVCTVNGDCPDSTCDTGATLTPNTGYVSANYTNRDHIKVNRDFFESTARPAYTKYGVHPLSNASSLDDNVAGLGGYHIGNFGLGSGPAITLGAGPAITLN